MTDGTAFHQLQEEMRGAFEATVLDLPRAMLVQYPHLVHDAHIAIVVVELTLAATRDAIRLLSWLKSNAPSTRVLVVANRIPSGGNTEISRKDFESSIERSVDFVVPFEPKSAVQAAKLGKSLAEVANANKLSQPLVGIAASVLATVDEATELAAAAGTTKPSLAGSFKAMLSTKLKPEKAVGK